MKKILALALALLISLMFVSPIGAESALQSLNFDEKYLTVYNHIYDDYVRITGITEQKSNELFKKAILNDLTRYKNIDNFIFEQENLNAKDKIEYIEYNYGKISDDIGDLKDILAEYLLYMVLNFYIEYAEDNDYAVWNSYTTENAISYDTIDAFSTSSIEKYSDGKSNISSSSSGVAELTIFSMNSGETSS